MKVALKANAELKIKYKPAVCTVDANASAGAGAACAGGASAGTGGSGGGGECKAAAAVNASVNVKCTEPELTLGFDAKLALDKSKAEMTLKAIGRPAEAALGRGAHRAAQECGRGVGQAATELKDMGPKFVQSFRDQAMCISGQIAAAANAGDAHPGQRLGLGRGVGVGRAAAVGGGSSQAVTRVRLASEQALV